MTPKNNVTIFFFNYELVMSSDVKFELVSVLLSDIVFGEFVRGLLVRESFVQRCLSEGVFLRIVRSLCPRTVSRQCKTTRYLYLASKVSANMPDARADAAEDAAISLLHVSSRLGVA